MRGLLALRAAGAPDRTAPHVHSFGAARSPGHRSPGASASSRQLAHDSSSRRTSRRPALRHGWPGGVRSSRRQPAGAPPASATRPSPPGRCCPVASAGPRACSRGSAGRARSRSGSRRTSPPGRARRSPVPCPPGQLLATLGPRARAEPSLRGVSRPRRVAAGACRDAATRPGGRTCGLREGERHRKAGTPGSGSVGAAPFWWHYGARDHVRDVRICPCDPSSAAGRPSCPAPRGNLWGPVTLLSPEPWCGLAGYGSQPREGKHQFSSGRPMPSRR